MDEREREMMLNWLRSLSAFARHLTLWTQPYWKRWILWSNNCPKFVSGSHNVFDKPTIGSRNIWRCNRRPVRCVYWNCVHWTSAPKWTAKCACQSHWWIGIVFCPADFCANTTLDRRWWRWIESTVWPRMWWEFYSLPNTIEHRRRLAFPAKKMRKISE